MFVRWTVSALLVLILFTAGPANTQLIYDCPAGWIEHDSQCYNFYFKTDKNVQEAAIYCGTFYSTLVSINSLTEHEFVQKWLDVHDGSRLKWLTSGFRDDSGTLVWDGQQGNIATDYFPDVPTRDQKLKDPVTGLQYNIIVYMFYESLNQYMWSWGRQLTVGPFICEMTKTESWRFYQTTRDFSFGNNETNPSSWETGPNITFVSPDTVLYDFGQTTTTLVLECLATGNPLPVYRWLRKRSSLLSDEEVTPDSNPGYSISNGRLTIVKPDKLTDVGVYTCVATNKAGTVRSDPVEVTYGYIGEFSNVKPSTVEAVLYMGVDLNCPVPIHNTDLTYSWYKADVLFLRSEYNPQYFLSRNGHLYISEIQASDQDEYYCIVFMKPRPGQVMSGDQPPSRTSLCTTLHITGGNPNTYGPDIQNQFPQVFPDVPMVGDDVHIECLAFGRLPLEYSWVREDGPLNSDAYIIDHNRVLIIPRAGIADTGIYTCVVRSQFNVANKTVHLQIKAKPYFPYPLQNQHLDEGSSFTWSCHAMALPKPIYTWYKDGHLLKSDSNDGIKIYRNTLTIDKVEAQKHNGMYQCEASNEFGLSRSSAQLRSPLDRSRKAARGGNVTISCHPEAAPRASIKWFKGDRELMQVKANGDLELSTLTQADAGQYTCVATNSLGEARSACFLDIQGELVFTDKPEDIEIEQNSTAYLHCKVSFDKTQVDVTYEWIFYHHVIDFSTNSIERAHYIMPETSLDSGKLLIVAAQFHHAGLYTCVVKSVAGTLSDSAYVTVRGPPGEPAGVQARKRNDANSQDYNNVAIWWQDGEVHGYPITKYKYITCQWMIIMEGGEEGESRRIVGNSEDIPASHTVFNVSPEWRKYDVTGGLSPGTAYQFRVIAGSDQSGYGPPSSGQTKWFTTKTAAPIFAPPNVGGGGGSVGLLRITWNPLPRSHWGAPNIRYIVYYRRQQENNNLKWGNEQLTQTEFNTVVGVQYYYTPYEAKVQAINDVGFGPKSTVTIVYSAEDMPTNVMPIYDTFEVINGTAAVVFWKPVPNTREAARGTVYAYQ
ncbi:hypothetical protein Btru_057496, partial [Bulinus truncatus]